MHDVKLKSGDKVFTGWKSVQIQRDLRSLAGSFSLSLLDTWSPADRSWFFPPFSEVSVEVDDDLVLTGFVDSLNISQTPAGADISVAGRDKTSDLIDCSIPSEEYQFFNVNLMQITRSVLRGFDIVFRPEVQSLEPFDHFEFNRNQPVGQILEEWAGYRGLLFGTNENGDLILRKVGSDRSEVDLIEGENIKEYSISYDVQNRFSDYTILSQIEPSIALAFNVNQLSQEGFAKDSGVPRFRPKTLIADLSAEQGDAQKRAQWEATNRAADSEQLSLTVVGWRKGDSPRSPLWKVNELVGVRLPSVGIDQEMLIGAVSYLKSVSGGTECQMTLQRPDAYKPEPVKPSSEFFIENFGASND